MKSIKQYITENILNGESDTWVHLPGQEQPMQCNEYTGGPFAYEGSAYIPMGECKDLNGDKHFYMEKVSSKHYLTEKHWPHTQLAEGKDTKQWLVSGRTKPGFWEVHILKAEELEGFLGHDGFVSALALDFPESTTVLNPDTHIRWAVTKL